jgi:outer membrane protein
MLTHVTAAPAVLHAQSLPGGGLPGAGLPVGTVPAEGLSVVDAARTALAEQPAIRLAAARLDASRGDLRAVQGIFDVRLTSGFNQVRSVTANTIFEQQVERMTASSTADVSTLNGGMSKLLAGGQVLSSSLALTRTDVGAVPPTENRASVSVFLSQPLLRGRGSEVTFAPVRANRDAVEASAQDVRHLKAASVLSTAAAYWNYVAAVSRLEIFRQAEQRARTFFDETQALIQAGARPAVDRKQVQANLASRLSQRMSGEQGVYEARQSLGVAIGIPYEQIDALPLPSDAFPEKPAEVPALDAMVALARQRRSDLESARRREASASALLVVAENNLRPKLDLLATVGYAGLDEGAKLSRYLTSLGTRATGPQVTLGVSWDVSPTNNQALGRLARAQSQASQSRIEATELERTLASNVAVALNNVQRSAERLTSAHEATQLYVSAVQDQRELQQLGAATIIDLLNTEERLTSAQLDEVTAMFTLSIAITQLRFETGTLITADDQVDRSTLMTPPRP